MLVELIRYKRHLSKHCKCWAVVSKEMITVFQRDYDDYLLLAILTVFFSKDACIKHKGDEREGKHVYDKTKMLD